MDSGRIVLAIIGGVAALGLLLVMVGMVWSLFRPGFPQGLMVPAGFGIMWLASIAAGRRLKAQQRRVE